MKESILVFGGNGLLATELKIFFRLNTEYKIVFLEKSKCDVTSLTSIDKFVKEFRPSIIINCAGYTNVDLAEQYKKSAMDVNSTAVLNLAKICNERKIYLIHISTASVFNSNELKLISGNSTRNPINYYNKTKLLAEETCETFLKEGASILALRTYWLYGTKRQDFTDFVKKALSKNELINIVHDQYGQPTSAKTLCKIINYGIANRIHGFFPGTNTGIANRIDWAHVICRKLQKNLMLINPVSSSEFKSSADRPFNTALSHSGKDFMGIEIEDWENALLKFLNNEN
jgi:dTDP-4-dehydrorhamnose reductase